MTNPTCELRSVVAVLLFFFLILPAPAQVTGLGDFYNLDDFSTSPTISAPRDYVSVKARYAGKHLVLEAKIAAGWHLYSATQPKGGTIRSEFSFELPKVTLEEIRPTAEPRVSTNVPGFSVDIEEHDDVVAWVFTFREELTEGEIIRGTLDGQVCQDGEGGTCIPITVPFQAQHDPELNAAVYLEAAKNIGLRFVYRPGGTAEPKPTDEFVPQEMSEVTGFGMVLLYAFLGGLILNVMPCVLPVIGLKIMSFFEQAGKSRARAFYLNAWYSLGLLSVFLFLAAMSYGLSQLFSFDLFSIVMACVVFAMALSLMDVWELSVPGFLGSGTSVKLTQQEGAAGAFFKGIITTLLAIPCGAPLLSPAVNWADMQIRSGNTVQVFIAYGVIGLGMASPYLIVGAFPELLRFLPKPGAWMDTFKKVMGYFLLVAVIWILYFIQLDRMLPTVTLLFALWFACWMIGRLGYTAKSPQRIRAWIVSLVVVVAALLFSFNIPGLGNPYTLENAMKAKLSRAANLANPTVDHSHWTLYTPERFDEALAAGRPVVVDFTADWCMNCKALEIYVLETKPVLDKLDEKNAVSLMADRTKEGDASAFLRKLGADIVPTLAIFDPKKPNEPMILRGGYTQKTLLELLDQL